jgi:methylthioribose-1-phosphate isomerase
MKIKYLQLTGALLIGLLASGVIAMQNAQANQPHMESALQSLENARAQLNEAERDKGGHRTKAVKLINEAIEQVKAGIADGA